MKQLSDSALREVDFHKLDSASQSHPVWRDPNGVIRFESNAAVCWCLNRISLNDLWCSNIPILEMMEFYRMMGYSVCGYWDIFGDYIIDGKVVEK